MHALVDQLRWMEIIKVLPKPCIFYHLFSPKDFSIRLCRWSWRSWKSVSVSWVRLLPPPNTPDILFIWFKIVFCAHIVQYFLSFRQSSLHIFLCKSLKSLCSYELLNKNSLGKQWYIYIYLLLSYPCSEEDGGGDTVLP